MDQPLVLSYPGDVYLFTPDVFRHCHIRYAVAEGQDLHGINRSASLFLPSDEDELRYQTGEGGAVRYGKNHTR